jgi:hypothetical protein
MALDDLGIDDQAAGDVLGEDEHGVDGEEGLGDGEALIGAVVEGAFEPLGGGGEGHGVGEGLDETRQ